MGSYILAIDQGTTSTRAIIFDGQFRPIASDQMEFKQYFPNDGWVEHDAEEIWQSVVTTCRNAIAKSEIEPSQIAGIGITNQRETTIIWDRKTGKAIAPAIVWQDRRTADYCDGLKAQGLEKTITKKTGLLLDPYFSATKVKFLLDNVEGARAKAENGDLAFGTVDSFLLWHLSGGKVHKTDATNASRTMLFNIVENQWDDELLTIFDIPRSILPEVHDCAFEFGVCEKELLGAAIPILGIAGDQHAATVGQACFEPGMMKSTYGTGCFAMLNTGSEMVPSSNRLLTTIAYRLDGKTTYALEGSIFIAGAAVQWLRDGLKLISDASQTGDLALNADLGQEIIMVPAFAGLGAPYWEPRARGAIFGITRATTSAELAKATLEAVCYQTRDLIEAMNKDWSGHGDNVVLRVDGGMVASDWTMQFLADILNARIDRPDILETTALGAAWLAGYKAGIWPDAKEFARQWHLDKRFEPSMDEAVRAAKYKAWKSAVAATISHATID